MKEYNVYILDYGHVNATHVITARDDEDAIEQARHRFLRDFDVEIREQRRFVMRLKPPG